MDDLLTSDKIIEFCAAIAVRVAELLPGHPDSIQVERIIDWPNSSIEIRMAWGDQHVLTVLPIKRFDIDVLKHRLEQELVQEIFYKINKLSKNFPQALFLVPGYHHSDREEPEWLIPN